MSTIRYYPLLNAAFQINIGSETFSFARIKNISEIIEVETVQEGGNNWTVHNLARPISSSHKLILERGFLVDGGCDPGLTAGSRVYDVTIMVMEHGKIKKTYSFKEGIVTRWEISDFDALQGQVIYNTIEILHNGLSEGKPK
ncbi:MAG: phage tail protein [Lachnospiraceae bacterium]|nr:phage tail protein [Lachnospiraceae bacterium]